MVQISRASTLCVTLAACASVLTAATPAIGVAISDGNIRINDSKVAGNASVFDGTTLRTETSSTRVQMNGGAQLRFSAASQAKLFSDHMVMQQGSAEFSGFSANANGLSVNPAANSSASISMSGKAVQVAALTGSVRVLNAQGVMVANLFPGRALSLTPQDAGASAPSSMVGCVVKSGSTMMLTDETSNVTAQLRGGSLKAGKRVQVTGTMVAGATPMGGATQVIAVTNVKTMPGSCAAMAKTGAAAGAAGAAGAGAAGAAGGAAGAAAGAAAGIGAGIGATTAVVAGVAAAAVAGTAAAVATTSSGDGSAAVAASTPVACPISVSPCK